MLALALLLAILPDSLDAVAPRPAVFSAAAAATWDGAPLSVRLPFAARLEALPAAPGRGVPAGVSAGVAGGTATLGSLLGGIGGVIAYAAIGVSTGRTVQDTPPPLAIGLVAVGTVVGAAAGVAYLGQPTPPAFAGFPRGESPLRPTDWKTALPGILVATPVGLALGYVAGRVVGQENAPLTGMAVALPVAQGIGAGLAVLRSRRAERR